MKHPCHTPVNPLVLFVREESSHTHSIGPHCEVELELQFFPQVGPYNLHDVDILGPPSKEDLSHITQQTLRDETYPSKVT